MKKIGLIIGLTLGFFLVFCSFNKHKEISLTFNLQPAERFINLMNYLEKSNKNGFKNTQISQEAKNQNLQLNKKDVELAKKIDSLLSLPIYNDFSENMMALIDSTKYLGKEAYRNAFFSLPLECIRMRAGLPELWVKFWENDYNSKAVSFLSEIAKQKDEINKKVVNASLIFLPENIEAKKIEILFCFDGNRGCFATEDKIIMDMLSFQDFDISKFSNILAHELHHILYNDYLSNYLSIDEKNQHQKALFSFQERIISEGIAQQINYKDYTNQVKALYNNEQLIKELYNEWITSMREISKSNNPVECYEKARSKMWNISEGKLKKYCTSKIESRTMSHRPTIDYYISYQLYNSILQKGGVKKLKYVIEYPDCLLKEYNNVYTETLLIPKIPDDIVDLWKTNFKRKNT